MQIEVPKCFFHASNMKHDDEWRLKIHRQNGSGYAVLFFGLVQKKNNTSQIQ